LDWADWFNTQRPKLMTWSLQSLLKLSYVAELERAMELVRAAVAQRAGTQGIEGKSSHTLGDWMREDVEKAIEVAKAESQADAKPSMHIEYAEDDISSI